MRISGDSEFFAEKNKIFRIDFSTCDLFFKDQKNKLSDRFGFVNFTYEIIDEYGATSEDLGQVQIEIGWLNDAPEFVIEDQSDGSGNEIDTIEVLEDFEDVKLAFSIPKHLPEDEADGGVNEQIVSYSINPASIFIIVDLPVPFGPTTPTTSPLCKAPSSALKLKEPRVFSKSRQETI